MGNLEFSIVQYARGKQDVKAYKRLLDLNAPVKKEAGFFAFNRGEFKTDLGGYEDYLLSTSSGNANRISPAQWTYRNRKRISKGMIRAFSKSKEGRALLRKYKIKLSKS